MKSVMRHQFSQVPKADIPRSSFNRSHGHKTTFDAGLLIPIYVDEALPGDTFSLSMTSFARLATPVVPIMDNMVMDYHFFSVPIRLLWDNWERMMGSQDNPDDTTDYLIPQVSAPVGGFVTGSLEDYFGIPLGVENIQISALWHRAYNLIYNDWFRDENLQDSVAVPTDDGPDPDTNYGVLRRGKRHDYFTSCLPWPQKGPGVELPLGSSAPVTGIGAGGQAWNAGPFPSYETDGTAAEQYDSYRNSATDNIILEEDPSNPGFPNIRADLSSATAATINSLRQAFQLQKLLERDARSGTRYVELLKAHFGVTSPDFRLQRPELLCLGSTPVNINPVAQTGASGIDQSIIATPQGNLAAFGTAGGNACGFNHSFVEHCVVIGLVSVRADLTYQKGIPRMFSRRSRFDFYWPALAMLGEQSVLNKEIYAQGTLDDDSVFGYQERWAEYRYFPSKITGKFRSSDPQSLDVWHLSQDFTSLPTLSPTFIEEDPPVDRVIAVQDEPQFIFDSYFQIRSARPMPVYSVPGLIDHF